VRVGRSEGSLEGFEFEILNWVKIYLSVFVTLNFWQDDSDAGLDAGLGDGDTFRKRWEGVGTGERK